MRRQPLLCMLAIGAAAIGAAAAPAYAGDRNELTIGTWNRALRSSSANAVTDENLTGGALAYARDVGLRPVPGLVVWATGAFTWAGAEGTMFRTLATDVGALGLAAGGRARYHLHQRVVASARLDLGAARTKLRLEDSMGRAAGDARWGAIATAAAAVDLYAVAGPRFSLGLRFELGYTVASAPALTAEPDGDGDDDTILLPRSEASLGHLDLGGRFFGFSLVSQF